MVENDRQLADELRKIRFARFAVELQVETRLKLPPYKGSTFRGAFGNTFKQLVCVKRDRDCATCLIRHQCVYQYIFETPVDGDGPRRYTFAPHPFVIRPPEETRQVYEPGECLEVGLVLVGRAVDQLPFFIYAFDEMGQRGLGQGRGKTVLRRVFAHGNEENPCIYEAGAGQLRTDFPVFSGPSVEHSVNGGVRLRLRTPTRLKDGGRFSQDLEFSLLARSLLRRSADLARYHCGQELQVDFRTWVDRAAPIRQTRAELQWQDWERYSHRQQTRMKMGGLVGEVEYAGEIGPFGPLLCLGEDLHVGKGTGFGLGRYEIV